MIYPGGSQGKTPSMKTLTLEACRGISGRFQFGALTWGLCLTLSRVASNSRILFPLLHIGWSNVTTMGSGAPLERGMVIRALGGSPANQVLQFDTSALGLMKRDSRIGRSLNIVTGATSRRTRRKRSEPSTLASVGNVRAALDCTPSNQFALTSRASSVAASPNSATVPVLVPRSEESSA